MRKAILVFLFAIGAYASHADLDNLYWMKVSIKMKSGNVHEGYFSMSCYNLRLQKDEQGWMYRDYEKLFRLQSKSSDPIKIHPADTQFNQVVRQYMEQTTWLFADVELIPINHDIDSSYLRIAVDLSPVQELKTTDIATVTVDEVYFSTTGIATESRCKKEDRTWLLKKVKRTESAGGAGLCNYTAVFFEDRSKEVDTLLEELKALYANCSLDPGCAEDQEKSHALTAEKIEELRKRHVLITTLCSC